MKTYDTEAAAYHANVDEVRPHLDGLFGERAPDVATAWLLGSDNGRLTIPYLTKGPCVNVRKHCLQPGHHACDVEGHEVVSSLDRRRAHLYNAQAVSGLSPVLCVVEGEVDTIVLDNIIGIPTVGVPSHGAWVGAQGRAWSHLVSDFPIVIIVGHGDFVAAIAAHLPDAIERVQPEFESIQSLWREQGAQAVRNFLNIPGFDPSLVN